MSKSSQRRRVVAARRFKQILAASIFAASFFGSSVLKGESPAQPIINRYVAERQASATSEELPPIVQRAKHDAPAKALPSASLRRAPKPVAIQAAFESPVDGAGKDSGVRQTSGKQEPTPAKPRAVTIQPAPEELPPVLTGAEMRAKLAPLVSGAEMRAQKAAEAAKQAKVQTQAKVQAKATEIVAETKKKGMEKVEKVMEAAPATALPHADSPSPWMQSLSAAAKEVTAPKAADQPVVMASKEMPLEPISEAPAEVVELPPVRLGSPKPAKPAPVAMAPAKAMAPPKSLFRSQQVAAQFEEEEENKPAPAPKAEEPAPLEPAEEAPAPAAPVEDEPAMLAPVEEAAPGEEGGALFREIKEMGDLEVMVHRSKILRTKTDLYRTAVVDDGICEIVQFTPRELSIIGKSQGATHVTFWFDDPKADPVTYLVKVTPDVAEVKKVEDAYKLLEDVINEMYPDSKITLSVVADKVIVKGQAKDSEEAFQIITLIRGQGGNGNNMGGGFGGGGFGGSLNEGIAAPVLSDSAVGNNRRSNLQVINMLRVPGVQQVALRVKIAELNRTAARNFGASIKGEIPLNGNTNGAAMFLNAITGTSGQAAPTLLTRFDGDNIQVGLNLLQQQGVIKLLGEPTLVTMSGRPATFIAGGEFAVPTIVGSAGLNAVTTDFRAYGAIISFLPTVVDKDRIRLEVSPEFSQINANLTVNNIPGLRTRSATTTVEMREGQSLAIAGLLEDSMTGNSSGDIPFLAQIFGKRSMQRSETELLILVSPELVHPMDAEEVPPLPGFDVQEPNNKQFFFKGQLEGNPTQDYRSTVWPRLKKRYGSDGPAMTSGPFGHGK